MLKEIRPAIIILVLLTLITGLAYPLAMTAIAGVLFPEAGAGQPDREGRQGDRLRPDRAGIQGRQILPWPALGDLGAGPGRFHQDRFGALQCRQFGRLQPRPDQQGAERPDQGRRRQAEGRKSLGAVPVDLVTTSASGLDPDISPEGALFQVPRVAKARNMPEDRVRALVTENTEGRFAGLLGEPRVNVLALNLALDAAASEVIRQA